MTEQLERDLADLFQVAADRVDVRPPARAAARLTRLNTALAAALTLALIGGVAVAGTRLASGPGRAGVSVSGGDAKTILMNAVRRTFERPVRIVTTMQPPMGSAQTTETELDYAHKNAVQRTRGQTQLLAVDGQDYQRLGHMGDFVHLPKGVQWLKMAPPPAQAMTAAGGWDALFGVDPAGVDNPAVMSRLSVKRLNATQFQLSTPGPGQEGSTAVFTLGADGTVTRAAIQITFDRTMPSMPPGANRHMSVVMTIEPLTTQLRVSAPDPRTVVTDAEYQRLLRRGTSTTPQECVTSTPSPQSGGMSTSVVCSSGISSSTVTVTASRAPTRH